MTRTGLGEQRLIVLRAGVGVADDCADGSAGGLTVVDTGQDLRQIGFLAGGGLLVAAGCTALHLAQYERLVVVNTGREAVEHNADTGTVRFTEDGNFECVAPGRTHVAHLLRLQI